MAKKLEFESERLERRQNARRYIVPAVGLLVMMIAAAPLALLLRSERGGTFAGGEGTPYPWTWTEKRNGDVLLVRDRAAAENHQWTVVSGGESDALTVRTEKQQKEKSRFVLTPTAEGRSSVTLALALEDGTDRLCEMTALAEVRQERGRLKAYILSTGSRQFQGRIGGGEGSGWLYEAAMDESNILVLSVKAENPPAPDPAEASAQEGIAAESMDEEALYDQFLLSEGNLTAEQLASMTLEEKRAYAETLFETQRGTAESSEAQQAEDTGWHCESDNESVAEVFTLLYTDDGVSACILPGSAPGTSNVRMYSKAAGVEIDLVCQVDDSGSFLVTSHELRKLS